ncbi:MAG TPA: hypothetical protein VLA52_09625, partial [Thermohalobaculum sp.]|nr:hypothetical protein [Thermohalobaculum sp.]
SSTSQPWLKTSESSRSSCQTPHEEGQAKFNRANPRAKKADIFNSIRDEPAVSAKVQMSCLIATAAVAAISRSAKSDI